ncbi:hypothetical protein BC940DRAFT_291309 [Gongronella butleri]|nr:hypothetical protein BC940DRAFT_291309 [Gongronella butleri]
MKLPLAPLLLLCLPSLLVLADALIIEKRDYGCPGYKQDCVTHCKTERKLHSGFCFPQIAGYKCVCY